MKVTLEDGRVLERSLRAGIETADLEVNNPSLEAAHGRAELPVQHRYIRDRAHKTYATHGYLTEFDISPPSKVTGIELRNTTDEGVLWVTHVLLVEAAPKPGWRKTRAGRWMSYR